MVAITRASSQINNLVAVPMLKSNRIIDSGMLQHKRATVEVAAADSDGSVYPLFTVRSHALIKSLKLAFDAITGGTSYSVGLYTLDSTGTVLTAVSAALFVSAADISSGVALTEYRYSVQNIDTIEKKVYELLSLTTDPLLTYVVCVTANTVGSAAGTISAEMDFLV